MRRLLQLLVIGCASLALEGHCVEWLTDADAAREKARQENKFVLLDFTGSDWCGWCMKLKREVFDQPAFGEYAQANLVLVEVDFPHHKALSTNQKTANVALAAAYHITGYPTIIVLGPDGQLVGRLGYMVGGPTPFDATLEEMLKKSNKRPATAAENQPDPPRKPVTFAPIPPTVPVHYGSLALKGISGPKARRVVLINNADMMVGDTARVKVEDHEVVVCCKEIRDDSVLITADDKPMELTLGQH